jgi:uncharacterized protein (DUF362 family)
LDLIDAGPYLTQFHSFLLKPNYIVDAKPQSGLVTRPETLEGILTYLVERVGKDPSQVVLGEGGYPSSTESAFTICGARDLATRYGITLVNLNDDDREVIHLENSLALKDVNVAKTVRNTDCVISVPSLKTHSMAVTTLSMKNCMGCILPKGIMHTNLHKKIADLAGLINPKLAIIDGIIGAEGNEETGTPVPMNLIVAGIDYVAVDTVGSAIMGYGLRECKYLQLAAQNGLGTCDLDDIEVLGVPITAVHRKFSR